MSSICGIRPGGCYQHLDRSPFLGLVTEFVHRTRGGVRRCATPLPLAINERLSEADSRTLTGKRGLRSRFIKSRKQAVWFFSVFSVSEFCLAPWRLGVSPFDWASNRCLHSV
jgi:hypothetical protein